MKENQSVKPIIEMDKDQIVFEVRNKTPLILHMDKVHVDNIKRAAFVGMAQVRIVDAAAVGMADKDGRIISATERQDMKYNRMKALIEHYESGTPEWSRKGVGAPDKSAIILRALAQVRGAEVAEVLDLATKYAEAKHAGDLKKALRVLAQDPKVAQAVTAIETAGARLDADSELDEFAKA